jgi:hypothetical protein
VPTLVVIEAGAKRTFASALEWPGWSRSARSEDGALAALAAYAPRYAGVPAAAGIAFAPDRAARLEVVERLKGNATTDFGAPGAIATAEHVPLSKKDAERTCALVSACWAVFDRVASGAPAALHKGPRGGGRDRDAIVEHVKAAELAYARKVGIRVGDDRGDCGDRDDRDDLGATRAVLLEHLAGRLAASAGAAGERRGPAPGSHPRLWPSRYAARRIAWHVLDHAWEIEDRS